MQWAVRSSAKAAQEESGRYRSATTGTLAGPLRLIRARHENPARKENVLTKERIVAVGLLTQRDLNLLGQSFTRAWPIEEAPCFEGLIRAIDEADRHQRTTNPSA